MKRPKQLFALVEVVWEDAAAHENNWTDEIKISDSMVISVGFLLMGNKRHIIIAQDIDEEGGHNGRSQIPRGMVKSMKVLRRADG